MHARTTRTPLPCASAGRRLPGAVGGPATHGPLLRPAAALPHSPPLSWCACYGRAHFAEEAPLPPPTALATKPPASPGRDGKGGAGGQAAPSKEGPAAAPGEQLIPAWLAGRQGSGTAASLRDRFSTTQQSACSAAASPAGSPRAAASPTAAAHRGELLGGGGSAASSPRGGSRAGGGLPPLLIPTAAEEADRAELFSSPKGGGSGGRGSSSRAGTPVGKGSWASRFK